jgi:transcriptional regulator with XRE-family HTH domain
VNLREARDAAGLTQQQLAEKLGFKRTTPISLWERSPHVPEPRTIAKLAAAIGCAPAVLLRDVVTPYDALRGTTTVAAANGTPVLSAPEPLSAEDEEWLAVGRALSRLHLRRSALAAHQATVRVASGDLTMGAADGRYRAAPEGEPGAPPPEGPRAKRRPRPRRT